ncbi:heparinase II/III family protein, partial [Streptomyces sp. MP131-18]|uniref:heparinase II/III domain-containing protein n=1 Tax=Streptomyces sp. MP131-18 TaxID=1857892 RepID=UPI00097C3565
MGRVPRGRDGIRAALRAGRREAVLDGYTDAELWERARRTPPADGYLRAIDARAAEWERTEITVLPHSRYRLFADDGSRRAFENGYFGRRRRLADLALHALAHPDGGVSALEDTIWAICDEYTWALPAHLTGLLAADPEVPHARQIDLFAAETAFALAEIPRLLPARLAPLVTARAARETRHRVIEPFLDLPPVWWEHDHTNWTAVCACGVGMAALHLLGDDEEEQLVEITVRVVAAMERFLAGYGDDGACLEGLDYWAYGFGFFVSYAEALRRRTDGAIDLLADGGGKVERIALFPQRVFLSGAVVAAFSDARPKGAREPGLAALLNHRFPAVTHAPEHLAAPDVVDHCGRWGPALRALVWATRHPRPAQDPAPDEGGYLADAQWMIGRHRDGGRELAFAAKGGHNQEPHNHNDLGSFVVALNGEPLLAELGSGLYTRDYFGPARYDILCTGSHGHSVPLVNGTAQQSSASARAEVLLAEHGGGRVRFRLDLSRGYPVAPLRSLVRDFEFAAGTLTVRDEIAGSAPLDVTERFMSFFPITLPGAGRALVTGPSGALLLEYDATRWRAAVRDHRHDGHDGTTATVHSLDLTAQVADGTFELRITHA